MTVTDTLYTYLAYLPRPVLTGSGFPRRTLYTMYAHKLKTNANPNIAPANISRFLLSSLPKIIETSCAVYCWCVCVLLKVTHTNLIFIIHIILGIWLLFQKSEKELSTHSNSHSPSRVHSATDNLKTKWFSWYFVVMHAYIKAGLCYSVFLSEHTVNISLTRCQSITVISCILSIY